MSMDSLLPACEKKLRISFYAKFCFYLFICFDAMAAYKQIMPSLAVALTGMQKHNKMYTPLNDVSNSGPR